MAIVTLQHAASLRDLAGRIYGLAAEDPRVATAARALADANPYLSADLRNLPPETPVVIPPVEGLAPVENPLDSDAPGCPLRQPKNETHRATAVGRIGACR